MSDAPFGIEDALKRIATGGSLDRGEARATMAVLLQGNATAAQIGAFLMGLRVKGETEDEVAGLVEAMRAAAVRIRPRRDPVVDLCGTGGDASGTFNISTAASFVVAGAGVAVAKHGNRSASSQCGSADVLEALGVPIDLPPDRAERCIEETGFGFLFAPLYHPAMKHVAVVRRELKLRTIFNLLGPLTNPAGVTRQVIGVFDPARRIVVAEVLRRLGSDRVWVVHSADGLDELSISSETWVTSLDRGTIAEIEVAAADFGLSSGSRDGLRGGDRTVNARIVEAVLSGERGPCRDAVLLNAAAALWIAGAAADRREACARAAESIDAGAARRVLEGARAFR